MTNGLTKLVERPSDRHLTIPSISDVRETIPWLHAKYTVYCYCFLCTHSFAQYYFHSVYFIVKYPCWPRMYEPSVVWWNWVCMITSSICLRRKSKPSTRRKPKTTGVFYFRFYCWASSTYFVYLFCCSIPRRFILISSPILIIHESTSMYLL